MELPILQALRDKNRYRMLSGAVPRDMLDPNSIWVLDWYGAYFQAYPDHEAVDLDAMKSLLRLRVTDRNQVAVATALIDKLNQPMAKSTLDGIVSQLHELDFSGRAASLIAQYNAGGDVDLAYEINRLSHQTLRATSQSAPTDYNTTSIREILDKEATDFGLKLPLLTDYVKGLSGGDSVAIAARPDKGKTSLVAFILVNFASQIKTVFGESRPILWLNNEGHSDRIKPRLYQAALGISLGAMYQLPEAQLIQKYSKAIQDDHELIRLKDMHGASLGAVERVVEAVRPSVVVFDMLANFRMPGGSGNKAEDTEARWQEVREMAVRHDFVALSTVQISAEGDNLLYPPMSALKDSKTGAQGAADLIIMMGALNDPTQQALRGLATAKNKRQVAGKPSHTRMEVMFNSELCQFSMGN